MALLVVGANSSGKSSCAEYLASALDGRIVEFGDLVRLQIAADLSLDRDPSRAYEQLVSRHGSGLLARWVKDVISSWIQAQPLIMVGVRDEPSYRKILADFPSAIRIAVVAHPKERRVRDAWKKADTPTAVLSATAFAKRDAIHCSWGLDTILREADYTVINNGSRDAFYEELRLLARLIGRKHGKIIQHV